MVDDITWEFLLGVVTTQIQLKSYHSMSPISSSLSKDWKHLYHLYLRYFFLFPFSNSPTLILPFIWFVFTLGESFFPRKEDTICNQYQLVSNLHFKFWLYSRTSRLSRTGNGFSFFAMDFWPKRSSLVASDKNGGIYLEKRDFKGFPKTS